MEQGGIHVSGLQYFVARSLIALLFLVTALNGFVNFQDFVKYLGKKLPAAMFLAAIALSVKLLASLSIISGYDVSKGASALLIFMLIITPIYHDFWNNSSEMMNFFKNVAIIGALMLLRN